MIIFDSTQNYFGIMDDNGSVHATCNSLLIDECDGFWSTPTINTNRCTSAPTTGHISASPTTAAPTSASATTAHPTTATPTNTDLTADRTAVEIANVGDEDTARFLESYWWIFSVVALILCCLVLLGCYLKRTKKKKTVSKQASVIDAFEGDIDDVKRHDKQHLSIEFSRF